MKKKLDLNKFKIASLTTMKTLKGGTGDETGGIETEPNTLPPQCLTNTQPDPDYNSDGPLTPPTCLQTSAVQVTAFCNHG
ncbi:hypothetical protein [uncultured Dokdonia sp.]|uniref:hypothetical protein n=1 Tax=uncultured Dokdonia sp. TaxID=575653 RepID=UPI00261A5FAC|nr:hypothetical protein [uncultured Dokdonia sp.]